MGYRRPECAQCGFRHDLQTFQLRLKALSAKVAQDGLILTEDQVRWRKPERRRRRIGEIENRAPWIFRLARHVLCWCKSEGRGADLSADLHRHAALKWRS